MSEALKKIGDFLKSEEGKAVLAGGADFLASRRAGKVGQERLQKIGKKPVSYTHLTLPTKA